VKISVRPATPRDVELVSRLTRDAVEAGAGFGPFDPGQETTAELGAQLTAGAGLLAFAADRPLGVVRQWPDATHPSRLGWVGKLAATKQPRQGEVTAALLAAAADRGARAGRTALRAVVSRADSAGRQNLEAQGWQVLQPNGEWLTYGLPLARSVPDAAAMHRLGRALSRLLRAGDLVVLAGSLGAGKTTLAQGIGAGLSVQGRITSPTFVLAREHAGRLPLVHVDAYRLGSLAELDDLDLDTTMLEAVTLVEWGDGLVESLTDGHLLVHLRRSQDSVDERRWVVLRATGPAWTGRQDQLDTQV